MSDLIYRQDAIKKIHEEFDECLVWDESGETTANEVERILYEVPSADPDLSADGTLTVVVPKGQLDKVGRVIVNEESTKYCKMMYQEPEQKKGTWMLYLEPGSECGYCSECGTRWYPEDLYMGGDDFPKYCPECGASMINWKAVIEDE